MSTLDKNVFSASPVKLFFLFDSDNLDSVIFGNAFLAEIKDHSLRITPFQKKKKICYRGFREAYTLRQKVFSGAPVKCIFIYG